MSQTALPAEVAEAGSSSERELDVRPILARGGDPFDHIMKTTATLAKGEALHLVVGFEPTPLYVVMRSAGRLAYTEERAGVFHVWFYEDPGAPPVAPAGAERVPLQPPVDLDVRGLEPPAPMVTILEKLAELGAGAQLRVRHHREPVLLYDKLKLRGYAARCERRAPGDFLVHIAPAWALEP
jgi:uncharacterized protein (DUF2249 family)